VAGDPSDSTGDEPINQIIAAYLRAVQAGQSPDRQELLAQHPAMAPELAAFFADLDQLHHLAAPLRAMIPAEPEPNVPDAPGPAAEAATMPPGEGALASPGIKVRYFGDYELLEEVARGGMGVVYRVRQTKLKRIVALKMILSGHLATEQDVKRFYAEAQTAAGLQHPNIVAIHEVGQHDGQHYFSMDFVEGSNLAAMVLHQPLDPRQAARYTRTIAEAIHFAHEHGTLHRDLKPSNILIDQLDQPRVTDFGLARRLEAESGLTATGAIVGTPSYMPPEQASGSREQLTRASDVYSLGAVLYELVTGRPPFRAATPFDTLRQVLESEPAAPRLLNPSVARDLETIILKCLAKEPARRYATAHELADDLGAFLEGRPVQARRPGLAEVAVRWARKQRRSAILTGAAAAVSVLLMVAGIFGWQWYAASRLGSVMLTTEGPPLEAEVLDENDQPVIPQFSVPTRQPVSLPAGMYHLRLSAAGRLSETYRLLVLQGLQQSFDIGISDRQAWEPMKFSGAGGVVELNGGADAIVETEKGLQRRDGRSGQEIWQRGLGKADQPALADMERMAGRPLMLGPGVRYRGFGYGAEDLYAGFPFLVRPAPDLDGDGTPYLVWVSRRALWSMHSAPWMLAVSAKDGKVKWLWQAKEPMHAAGMLSPPLVEDVDGDGKPDFILTFGGQVEAISGRTGKSIWSSAGTAAAINRRGKEPTILVAARQLAELDLKTGKPVRPAVDLGIDPLEPPVFADLNGDGQQAVLGWGRDRGYRLTALSAATAQQLWQKELAYSSSGFGILSRDEHPHRQDVLVADLDGDGKPEIIVRHNPPETYSSYNWEWRQGRNGQHGWVGVEVLEGATGKTRWRRQFLRAPGPYNEGGPIETVDHFLVGPDLDGDGTRDIFMAALIDRYHLEAPLGGRQGTMLLVEACSGADGRKLWRYFEPVSEKQLANGKSLLGPLRLGPPGSDGRPQLVVTFSGLFYRNYGTQQKFSDLFAQTYLFCSSTGRLEHTWPGLFRVDSTDFNGDGITDLYGLRWDDVSGAAGSIHSLLGGPPELWRRLGPWDPAIDDVSPARFGSPTRYLSPLALHGDLNGDGIPDLLVFRLPNWDEPYDSVLQAFSGKDGTLLWKAPGFKETLPHWTNMMTCNFLECRKLGQKGRSNVIVVHADNSVCWLEVLDGRTGKGWKTKLAQFKGPTASAFISDLITLQQPEFVDINGDGVLDVLVLSKTDEDALELQALDGRSGEPLWSQPPGLDANTVSVGLASGHLEPDGSPDIVVATKVSAKAKELIAQGIPAGSQLTSARIAALNAADGQQKWVWTGPEYQESSEPDFRLRPTPLLADLDGDGRQSVCLPIHHLRMHPDLPRTQILVVDSSGQLRQTLEIHPPAPGEPAAQPAPRLMTVGFNYIPPPKRGFRLWSHDVNGDGKQELLFVSDGKVRAVNVAGPGCQPPATTLWEWPLPGGVGEILDIQPAQHHQPALVAVRSGKTAYGLDGCTGRLRWRCDGPGEPAALQPCRDGGQLPGVVFHASTPESTVCLQAMPVGPDQKYLQPEVRPSNYGPTAPEIIPWPWETPAKDKLAWAWLAALLCFGLVVNCVRARRWFSAVALLAFWLGIPLAIAALQIHFNPKLSEEEYSWQGFVWIWPYVASHQITIGLLGLGVLGAALGCLIQFAVRFQWRPALGVLVGIAVWLWFMYYSLTEMTGHRNKP
jgi:tRNA A-37 threonylcarbamoyl transferase component Bud32/outer membrane protein assembly factor BamB